MTNFREIHPDQLELDTDNPRFGLAEKSSPSEALKFLFETSDIGELWNSIVENGFQKFEPLVAYQPDMGVEKYVVVEGNRRLAAVKTLLDPELLSPFSSKKPPAVPQAFLSSLENLPVTVIDERGDADEYIGFRHVNGARNWEPLPKAKFCLKLLNKLRLSQEFGDQERIRILARQIGDQPTDLTRNLVSLKILEQAMQLGFLQDDFLSKTRNDFSHLYSMLSNPQTREYVGLPPHALQADQINDSPIPESHATELRNLVTWLFGSPDGETKPIIKRQGTDRPALQKVIACEQARDHLVKTGDFEYAKQLSGVDV